LLLQINAIKLNPGNLYMGFWMEITYLLW
jgi:hypothetical protein